MRRGRPGRLRRRSTRRARAERWALEHGYRRMALDTAELTVAGQDPAAWIRRFGQRIRHVHLKDALARLLTERRAIETADIKGLSTNEVGRITASNFEQLFSRVIEEPHESLQ